MQHRLKVVVRAISALKDATRAVLAAAASLELIRATHARRALSASSPAALPRWYAQTVPRAVLPIVLPLWRARHVTLANLATPRVLRRARIARRGTSLSSPRPSYASSAIVERSLRVRARANALHAPEGSPARAAPQRALTARRGLQGGTACARDAPSDSSRRMTDRSAWTATTRTTSTRHHTAGPVLRARRVCLAMLGERQTRRMTTA